MAFEKAKAYLAKYGLEDRIIVTEHSSATVAEAAEALGCAEEMIAKTVVLQLLNSRQTSKPCQALFFC